MDFERQLLDMLQNQIVSRGIANPRILEAMQRVPRHHFVPVEYLYEAYQDHPVTLPEPQSTISQPYMVAYMTEALQCRETDRILEIGTGSGYQAAILSYLCREVYTVERHESLMRSAERILQSFGIKNVHCRVGDGVWGWKEQAPFDRIIVTAAAQTPPASLLEQLTDSGILLIPLGEPNLQTLTRIQKIGMRIQSENLISCVFVPLITTTPNTTPSTGSDFVDV